MRVDLGSCQASARAEVEPEDAPNLKPSNAHLTM